MSKPHVTIETDPGLIDMAEYSGNNIQGMMNQEDAIAAIRRLEKQRPGTHGNLSHWVDELKSLGAGVPRIVQIKGPSNATPDPKYFPLIQDFIKQGKWSEIDDWYNTGLTQEEINAILKR